MPCTTFLCIWPTSLILQQALRSPTSQLLPICFFSSLHCRPLGNIGNIFHQGLAYKPLPSRSLPRSILPEVETSALLSHVTLHFHRAIASSCLWLLTGPQTLSLAPLFELLETRGRDPSQLTQCFATQNDAMCSYKIKSIKHVESQKFCTCHCLASSGRCGAGTQLLLCLGRRPPRRSQGSG